MSTIASALQDRAKAHEELWNCYHKAVGHLVHRIVGSRDQVRDLTLEIFIKAFRSLPTYHRQGSFQFWLFSLATRHSTDYLQNRQLLAPRRQLLYCQVGEKVLLDLPDPALDPQQAYIQLQQTETIEQFLFQLSRKYAIPLRMRYLTGLSYEDIAAELHLPVGTVKIRVFRAKKLLRRLLRNPERN